MPKKPIYLTILLGNMNIYKIVLVALLVISFSGAGRADAALFSKNNAKNEDTSGNWSFDSLYQSIQGFSLNNQKSDSTITATIVVPANSPVSTRKVAVKPTQKTYIVQASAYSSTVDQTDDSPFITASGTYVRDGVVAANFLPIGTLIKIPDIYGNKIFVVEDRMNSRYWMNVDLWFPTREAAMTFGRKQIKIEIVS
ncbi:3D domain-containing protein [Candidatus Parcubacteria bacterium]|nr:3D domain-containing protein [Candidatus Parcubacteria bacterium]